ncbi:MAG: TlpA disulfide reductase family protein [Isosphaeraceae bacterium]
MTDTPAPPRNRTPWIVLSALVIAWCLYLVFFGPQRGGKLAPPDLKTPVVGRPADFAWTLKDLDGKSVDFASYRGKAVFLNLWATWCPPCVAELPSIANLARNARLKDVAFVCVTDEDAETVRRFLDQQQLNIPVLLSDGPPPPVFHTEGIPATFMIDPNGQIVLAEVGSAQWDAPSVVDRLEALAHDVKTASKTQP